MIGVTSANPTHTQTEGIRPVNLSTDLARLADLIELTFAESMDSSGRAALREMRYLAKMGPGVRLLSRLNELAMGIGMGYVWEAGGELIGNVSIYAASWPRDLGQTFIIANVGTHPDYQNQGIAGALMRKSLDTIRQRGGDRAVLQVEVDNEPARHLYRKLGFVEERAWTSWRRGSFSRNPPPLESDYYIRRRRRGEWREELSLAQAVRPPKRGGLGWLKPLHISQFRRPFWKTLLNWLNLRGSERLLVRDPDTHKLAASLWTENHFTRTHLTLLNDPLADALAAETLLNNIARRHNRSALTIDHPADDVHINDLLRRYDFHESRQLMHMRWEAR